ncbi:MAG: RNA polymerase sigma factor [Candidatus Kapabacteria bacterium]|nr:RNA polymerase sigma factor [Ignavibacteriota bacterium]MCW5884784.1 RNA polymerase sigma factor [Candidatus Kapabacteria bacterium]
MNSKEKQEKFLELFHALNDSLYMYARALAKNSEDAEDLVSDTILVCYEKFDNLRDLTGFKGYVFKTIRSLHRQKYRRSWLFGFFDEKSSDNIVSSEPAPDLPYDIGILYKEINNLPELQKEAVVLFEISGFSIREIMQIQGGTESGVKSRIKRGKEKLRSLMMVHHSDKDFLVFAERSEEVEK